MNIRNIVATAKSHVVLDLDFIHSLLPSDLCYRSSSFGSLNLQDDFRTLFQLFKNGNVVVIGGNDENEAKNIFDGYVSQLNYLGMDNFLRLQNSKHHCDIQTRKQNKFEPFG